MSLRTTIIFTSATMTLTVALVVILWEHGSLSGVIAGLNLLIAAGLLALGSGLLWKAHRRDRLFQWPVSAEVAAAGPYVGLGLIALQLALLRTFPLGWGLDRNGMTTALLRLATCTVIFALGQRVFFGRLDPNAPPRQDGPA